MNINIEPTEEMILALSPYLNGRKIIHINCKMNKTDEYKKIKHLIDNSKKRSKPIVCITTQIEYQSIKEASKALGLDAGAISRCVNGKQKSTKGYIFKYKENQ